MVLDSGGADCLEPGARIVGWKLEDDAGRHIEAGDIDGPMDLELAFLEIFPRGRVVLQAFDDQGDQGNLVDCAPAPGPGLRWRARYRPALGSADVARYESLSATQTSSPSGPTTKAPVTKAPATKKEVPAGNGVAAVYSEIAASLTTLGRHADAAWILIEAMKRAGTSADLEAAFERSLAALNGSRYHSHALRGRGRVEMGARRPTEARSWFERALVLDLDSQLEIAQSNLRLAASHTALGDSAFAIADWLAAVDHFESAIAIHRQHAPRSYALLGVLTDGGQAFFGLSRLDEAEALLSESEVIGAQIAPTSRGYVATLAGLGRVAWQRADLQKAEAYYLRALETLRGQSYERQFAPAILGNLGLLAYDRGDFTTAEERFRTTLESESGLDAGSMTAGNSLNNLGMVANERGLWDAADSYYGQALEIYEALNPDSIAVARTLNNLSNNARHAGRLDDAERHVRRSLAMTLRIAPESSTHAHGEENLAMVLEAQGDLPGALVVVDSTLELRRRISPGSLRVARPLSDRGRILRKLPRLDEALEAQHAALSLVENVAPGSALEAKILHEIGLLHALKAEPKKATDFLCRAADALDMQKRKLGGNRKAGNPFDREMAHIHQRCLAALIDVGDVADAYSVLERSRVRELLMLLSERDLVLDHAISDDLRERRRDLADRYDQAYGELLEGAEEPQSEAHQALISRLADLRLERDALDAELRAADPRLATLDAPSILDARAAASALEPGTLLLAYSLGDEHSYVFALSRDGEPQVFTLPARRNAIDQSVIALRTVLSERSGSPVAHARELWNQLLAPVADQLAAHDRLLISPDGSLHTLPFAALMRPDGRHLVELLPSHVIASMTLYAEMQRVTPTAEAGRIVAFADPQVDRVMLDAPEFDVVTRSGLDFSPLPGARREAKLLQNLYPGRTQIFVGTAATEARLKDLAGQATVLHLATHGYVDPASPLDSGLMLAPSKNDADSGLLQVWEIFEQLSLNADLVTLSACETALGHQLAGEGMIGLTRAFHYAGARSILASLWRVSDDATSRLMEGFYRELRSGTAKDDALRNAQLEFLRAGPRGSSIMQDRGVGGLATAKDNAAKDNAANNNAARPLRSADFEWAAFELVGDRR